MGRCYLCLLMSIAEGGLFQVLRPPSKGKKVKGKKVKSRDLQCAMFFPGYFCKRAQEASTARTLSLNI